VQHHDTVVEIAGQNLPRVLLTARAARPYALALGPVADGEQRATDAWMLVVDLLFAVGVTLLVLVVIAHPGPADIKLGLL
jgi:hypothetical protein